MINKYEFGIPFETDAVVKQIKKSEGNPKGVQICCDNGFLFSCKLDKSLASVAGLQLTYTIFLGSI